MCKFYKRNETKVTGRYQAESLHGSVNSPIFMRGMAIISTSFKEITMST